MVLIVTILKDRFLLGLGCNRRLTVVFKIEPHLYNSDFQLFLTSHRNEDVEWLRVNKWSNCYSLAEPFVVNTCRDEHKTEFGQCLSRVICLAGNIGSIDWPSKFEPWEWEIGKLGILVVFLQISNWDEIGGLLWNCCSLFQSL